MKIGRQIGILGCALGVILLMVPLPALAQGCALCYTQAAASGPRMIQALKSGILILIGPPTLMTIGMLFVCYRKRNQTREGDGGDKWEQDWEQNSAPPYPSSSERDW